jgi:hypothetical protein
LAFGQRCEDAQRLTRFEGVIERPRIGRYVVPGPVVRPEAFEARVSAIDR